MSKNYNPKIHHRQSVRFKNYDYSQDGYYFVTIYIKDKIEYLGEIENEKMEYSHDVLRLHCGINYVKLCL